MANNDLNQKYTIERYCSKQDLTKILGSNLVDPFWKEISEFRKRLATDLPFFDTAHFKYYLTYIDSVQAKTAQINSKVSKFVGEFSKISTDSIPQYTFTRAMFKEILKSIAKINNLQVSEITLSKIIEGDEVDNEYEVLVHYFKALKELNASTFSSIDEEFLAKNYAILRGEIELTSFYRTSDTKSLSSMALVDRDYDQGIPAHLIEDLMPPLLDYLNSFDISLVSRISAIYFMFNYIKPFESYNLEMASLLVKKVLSMTNLDTSSIYIPIEIFVENKDFFEAVSREVKKTHDFTYAHLAGAEIIHEAFDIALAKLIEVYSNRLDTESKIGSNEAKIKEEFGHSVVIKRIEPKKVETKAEIQKRIESRTIKYEPEPVSEKELKARANDLLETNPFLRKAQADFYVHHCTYGRFYSIQQYVKYTGCVYETGRQAMDALAKYGYYKREQIKNKFVYTPINKE